MTAAVGPPPSMADGADELTPMLAQYYELCTEYEDSLVLFQVGDFYEAFCEAAEAVARICEVTLTQREDSTGEYPMAGIPIDNAATYVEPLLEAGFRVAIADQIEDPDEASGLVDRAVTRIVTPGTLTDDELLTTGSNYVACVVREEEGDDLAVASEGDGAATDDVHALAAVDVSTGDCRVTSASDPARIAHELDRIGPAELLLGPAADVDLAGLSIDPMVTDYEAGAFSAATARETVGNYADPDVLEERAEVRACGAVLSYAEYTQGDDGPLSYVSRLTRYDPRERMRLDATALRSLELFDRRGAASGATLLDVVDETATAPGRRELSDWLRRPLLDREAIAGRHGAVGELVGDALAREELHDLLRDVYDVERLLSRTSRGRANARDLRSLKTTLDVVPQVADVLADGEASLLRSLEDDLDELVDVRELIGEAIQPDPPQEITEGGVIRDGFDAELDELRSTEREGREWVADLEARERERTGIDSLSVGHNQVHGYYIEVTDANLDRVPDDYTRRQTLKNAERFYTPELKRREDEIIGAAERADALEYELFCEVRNGVAAEADRISAVADALARLDALVSLATVAAREGWTRPRMGADGIHVAAGRHPVVERTQGSFVPNDTRLGGTGAAGAGAGADDESTEAPPEPRTETTAEPRIAIITGPNMSGKSTYMRQVALICILAQVGSFVPADDAALPVLDRVFTRVGASDDIAGGQSTFMREMSELTEILHRATADSLVLLDEVGRGTSTADGLAIARATTEFIDDEVGAFTLFATHYHDLTDLADERERVVNRHFTATREDGDVTFLHRIAEGPSSSSYGIEVAELAGVPPQVVERSRELVEGSEPEPRTASLDRWTEGSRLSGDGHQSEDHESREATRPAGTANAGGGVDATESPAADGSGSPSSPSGSGSGSESPAGRADSAAADSGAEPDPEVTAVADELRDVDLARTTPLEALNRLHELQQRLEDDR
jgi:DNA mismatch repair protein MutS